MFELYDNSNWRDQTSNVSGAHKSHPRLKVVDYGVFNGHLFRICRKGIVIIRLLTPSLLSAAPPQYNRDIVAVRACSHPYFITSPLSTVRWSQFPWWFRMYSLRNELHIWTSNPMWTWRTKSSRYSMIRNKLSFCIKRAQLTWYISASYIYSILPINFDLISPQENSDIVGDRGITQEV